MEYLDSQGRPIRLTQDRLLYGEEFVFIDERTGVFADPDPGETTSTLRVLRPDGIDMAIPDLPPQVASQLWTQIRDMVEARVHGYLGPEAPPEGEPPPLA